MKMKEIYREISLISLFDEMGVFLLVALISFYSYSIVSGALISSSI